MYKSLWKLLVFRGILALIVGILAIAWPGPTVYALVVLFAVAAFGNAVIEVSHAVISDRAGAVFGHALLALTGVGAGVVAIVWPGITAFVLVVCIGVWAVLTGCFEVALAFAAGESVGERTLFALVGLLTMTFGVVLFTRPDIGALSLAEIFGFFSLIFGVTSLVLAANTKDAGDSLSQFLE